MVKATEARAIAVKSPKKPVRAAGDPLWYRDAIIYELRISAFHDGNGDGIGDFQGLTEKLDHFQELGVNALWLLPFYPSPLKDDGYDTADYTDVHPDLGTLSDFKQFLKEAHHRGLRVITELVLNHTSDQHPWFQRARLAKPGSKERNFYVWSENPHKYKDARIIFKDFERSNWSWDPVAEAYFWHRFYSHQPDLNFENPEVHKALLQVVDFWFAMGVDGLRLDAIPYLYEKEGTNCENLPETYEFLRKLRQHVDSKFENRMLLAEANQWPEDAVRYLENGDKCHMAFHFPLMPRMFMALHTEDRFPIVDILAQTPALPESCQWALFLRNHDELTLEMVTDEERDVMYEAYAKEPNSRINMGIRRRLAPLLENNRRKIELLNCLLFSLPGTPVLYYGDEIGMGDNAHLGDRNGVRTPMQWSPDRNAGFSRANPQRLYLPVIIDPEYHYESINVETQQRNPNSLLWWQKRIIALRSHYPALGRGTFELLQPDNHRILAFIREYESQSILVVVNLSAFAQFVELDLSKYEGYTPIELLGNTPFPEIQGNKYLLTPGPHMVFWFLLESTNRGKEVLSRDELPQLSIGSSWDRFLASRDRSIVEKALRLYLPLCRWYGSKAKNLKQLKISDVVALPSETKEAHILFLELRFEDGSQEDYQLPVTLLASDEAEAIEIKKNNLKACIAELAFAGAKAGKKQLLVDAMADSVFCQALYRILRKDKPRRSGNEPGLAAFRLPWYEKSSAKQALPSRALSAEQSNTSIIFGNEYILKVFRKLGGGLNPDLEIGRYLTEKTDFKNSPKIAAWLEYRRGRQIPATLAILQEFVPDGRDAWTYTRDEVRRYFDRALAQDIQNLPEPGVKSLIEMAEQEAPADVSNLVGAFLVFVELLGTRTAEMHLALAQKTDDPEFYLESYGTLYQRSVYQSMRNLSLGCLRLVRQKQKSLPEKIQVQTQALLGLENKILATLEEFRNSNVTAMRSRHHGDFHLGQVLYTGNDFKILDFEGEPARSLADRRRKRSPLRDVAGMIRSFHYASVSTLLSHLDSGLLPEADGAKLEPWSKHWYRIVASAYLRAYLKTAKGADFLPKDKKEIQLLLNVFLLEKALYEVTYELNNRPDWLRIPMHGIADVLAEGVEGGRK